MLKSKTMFIKNAKPDQINSTYFYFDLDGTLLDVKRRYYNAHVKACNKVGIGSLNINGYWNKKINAVSENKIMKLNTGRFYIYEKTRINFLENRELLKFDRIIPGAKKTLSFLKKKNITLLLLTLRRDKLALLDELSWLKLEKYFTEIICHPPSKLPYAVKTKIIKKKIGSNHNSKIYVIGDTEADIFAGKKVGATTIGVLTGIRNSVLLQSYKPDHIIKSISYLPNIKL